MGLFSEQREITVFAQTQTLDFPVPTLTEQIVYANITKQPIASVLTSNATGGLATKADTARRYAINNYTLGLPATDMLAIPEPNFTVIEAAISNSLSLPYGCQVVTSVIRDLSLMTAVYPYLSAIRGVLRDTSLAVNFDAPIEIHNIPDDWVIPTTYNGQKTVFSNPFVDTIVLTNDNQTVEITYRVNLKYADYNYSEPLLQDIYTAIDVPISEYDNTYTEEYILPEGLDLGNSYCLTEYYSLDTLGNPEGNLQLWYYPIESQVYPDIVNESSTSNAAYPIVPIRYENSFINEIDNPDLYRTGKQVLKKLTIPFDDLVSTLAENPDINDIDNAYVMFGIDIQTNDSVALKYLIRHFTQLATIPVVSVFDKLTDSLNGNAIYQSSVIIPTKTKTVPFNDYALAQLNIDWSFLALPNGISMTEYGLNLSIDLSKVTSVVNFGSIGVVGTITKEIIPTTRKEHVHFGETFADISKTVSYTKPYLVLKEQLTDTTYKEVMVYDLVSRNNIYKNRSVVTTLDDVYESTDEHNLVLPLNYAAVMETPVKERNALFADAIQLMITGYDDSHVQWYETSAFLGLVNFVVSAIGMIMGAPKLGTVTSMLISSGLPAIVSQIIVTVVFVASLQLRGISALFGVEAAAVIGVITLSFSNLAQLAATTAELTLLSAETILYACSTVISAANAVINVLLKDIETAYSEFMVDAQAQMEELQTKAELYDREFLLPFSYLQDPEHPKPDNKTKPDRFYDKIHVGNVGTLSLDMIESYVDRNLLLPEDIN